MGYLPDMLVAIVALKSYDRLHGDDYEPTITSWLDHAKNNWTDKNTGIITSMLPQDSIRTCGWPLKGSYILNLSPSGTAFFIGCASMFDDKEIRTKFLKTAEIAGSTLTWNGRSHYWLANVALVGESIVLAMRTSTL